MPAETNPVNSSEIWIIDRNTGGRIRETVLGDRWLRLAYRGPGSGLWRYLLRTGLPTRLLGWYADSVLSRTKIASTVSELGIDMAEYEIPANGFRSFNEFFYRKLKPGARPFNPAPDVVCSPADCRLLVYPQLDNDVCLPVKGVAFTTRDLLRPPADSADCPRFEHGAAMVARLCPADYHRFHFPVGGKVLKSWDIPGYYDSVNPLALELGIPVFRHNRRTVTLLDGGPAGRIAFVEVGAFGVGRIVQTATAPVFSKMDEKGYFAFGGSTIVLLFEAGRITFDIDLLENSRKSLETLIRAGDRLGSVNP